MIYNSDYGGVLLARSKRFCYSSGIHCPLVVRVPEKFKHLYPVRPAQGEVIDRLVSFVDMPKTWLSLAGSGKLAHVSGNHVFLGKGIEQEPAYHLLFASVRMSDSIVSVSYVTSVMPITRTICPMHRLDSISPISEGRSHSGLGATPSWR